MTLFGNNFGQYPWQQWEQLKAQALLPQRRWSHTAFRALDRAFPFLVSGVTKYMESNESRINILSSDQKPRPKNISTFINVFSFSDLKSEICDISTRQFNRCDPHHPWSVCHFPSSLFVSVAYQFCSLLFSMKVIDLWADDAFFDFDYIMYQPKFLLPSKTSCQTFD